MGLQIHVDGYIGVRKKGVQEVRQRLALGLRALRGDPVEVEGGRGVNWSGEGRLQVIPRL